jgi:hypothetical protein
MLFKPSNPEKASRAYLQCVATGISLTVFLVLIRFKVLGYSIRATVLSSFLPKAALTGYLDVLYAMGLTLFFGALLLLLPGRSKPINRVFMGVAVASLLCSLVNIQMVKMLGTPFNYQWFYYSDLLNSNDSFYSTLAGFSTAQIVTSMLLCVGLCVALLVAAAGLSRLGYRLDHRVRRWVPLVVLAGCAAYLPVARYYVKKNQYKHHKLANPVVAFVSSVASTLVSAPDLYKRDVPARPAAGGWTSNGPVCPFVVRGGHPQRPFFRAGISARRIRRQPQVHPRVDQAPARGQYLSQHLRPLSFHQQFAGHLADGQLPLAFLQKHYP